MEINIEQLSLESGVTIKGVFQKGDKITFLDLTPEEDAKVREALKTHIPQPEVNDITKSKIVIPEVNKLDTIIDELDKIKERLGID